MYLCALQCFIKLTKKPQQNPKGKPPKYTGDSENPVELHMRF